MSVHDEIKKNPIRIVVNSDTEIWITVLEFKEKDYIGIRKYYREAPEDMTPLEEAKNPAEIYKPTKKGISLTPQQFIQVMEEILPLYEDMIKGD